MQYGALSELLFFLFIFFIKTGKKGFCLQAPLLIGTALRCYYKFYIHTYGCKVYKDLYTCASHREIVAHHAQRLRFFFSY